MIRDDLFSIFCDETHKRLAYFIWDGVMKEIERNPNFVVRREWIKDKFNIGKDRLDKAIKFLKSLGLLETYPTYEKKGKFKGAEYQFYTFEDRVKSPSISTTRGPQAKTQAIAKKHGKKNAHETPEALPTKLLTEYPVSRLSENPAIYLQGGEGDPGGSGGFSGLPDEHKEKFLSYFTGRLTFQVFNDKRKTRGKVYQTNRLCQFEASNETGSGIFLTVNETDGTGRQKKNIVRVRAVFVDLDGSPIEPVLSYDPSLVVETSPGKYHAYWFVDDFPREAFSDFQITLAKKFKGDDVKDLCRCMRMPGYYHHKTDTPFLCRIIFAWERRYTFDQLNEKFRQKPLKLKGVNHGVRNNTLCRIVGGMVKANLSIDEIRETAEQFAAACNPPLSKHKVDRVLNYPAGGDWD
ncbi:DNA-primase RepB domain-containing protein [Desulfotignum balticum]|uniref:DNA-primase RepB domain-containing protein n=1 Tax=Desulfotignum balticum TaxID=115781 RepID=UPI00041C4E32|nr:DNA-primase RepB domain-containing protein [Desulfotignum balticum]